MKGEGRGEGGGKGWRGREGVEGEGRGKWRGEERVVNGGILVCFKQTAGLTTHILLTTTTCLQVRSKDYICYRRFISSLLCAIRYQTTCIKVLNLR